MRIAVSAVLGFTTILLVGALPSGCKREAPPPPEPGPPARIRLGMIPKLKGIPYFNVCREGAEAAAKELGVDLVYDGPTEADSNRQMEIINSWILMEYDAIAAAPNNPEAIAEVLLRAREKGIHVVTWDTDSKPEAREYFCNQAAYDAIAGHLLRIVAEEAGPAARIALVSGTETAANQNTWMRHMREIMAEKHTGMRIVEPVEYPGENEKAAYESVQGLLRRSDRPDAILGITTVSCPAAAKAVFDAGLGGKVVVSGVSLPSVMRPHVKSGTVKKFVLWNPSDLGYLTVHVAKLLAEGRLGGDMIDVGRLGLVEIRGREVILGEPLVFDEKNIDKYEF